MYVHVFAQKIAMQHLCTIRTSDVETIQVFLLNKMSGDTDIRRRACKGKSDVPVLPCNFTFWRDEVRFEFIPNIDSIQRVRVATLLAKVKEAAC